jgi:hypothetical protein
VGGDPKERQRQTRPLRCAVHHPRELTLSSFPGGTGDWRARTGAYDDLTEGTQITITDANGSPLATGLLEQGTYEPGVSEPCVGTCAYPFTVNNTPAGRDSYNVRIGDRPGPTSTMAQMQEGPSLTIRNPRSATPEAGSATADWPPTPRWP